jgi:hypothetical protein
VTPEEADARPPRLPRATLATMSSTTPALKARNAAISRPRSIQGLKALMAARYDAVRPKIMDRQRGKGPSQ